MVTVTVLSLKPIRTDGGNLGSKPQVQSEIQSGEQFPGNEHRPKETPSPSADVCPVSAYGTLVQYVRVAERTSDGLS